MAFKQIKKKRKKKETDFVSLKYYLLKINN